MASEVTRNPRADALLLTIALILLAWSAVVFILRLLLRLKILRATQWNTSQVLGGDDLFCALGTVTISAFDIDNQLIKHRCLRQLKPSSSALPFGIEMAL